MALKSAYRLMWMMVMFDLPVTEKIERKIATDFRNFLLDEGFEMSQFSVYLRFCGSREKTDKYVRLVQSHLPADGKVSVLFFTDKQFGEVIHLENKKPRKLAEKPGQYTLF